MAKSADAWGGAVISLPPFAYRGLYRFSDGRIVNADVNGAANILRKSKQNFDFEGLCRGLLASPLRIRVS